MGRCPGHPGSLQLSHGRRVYCGTVVPTSSHSVAIVGTGFASSFFLLEYLKHAPANARVLVLERGGAGGMPVDGLIVNRTPRKSWTQVIGFGGTSTWTGHTPRFHPNDFRTRSLYGVGVDWPLSYDDLEPYYTRVEDVMGVAGESSPQYPRSRPYATPAHALNAFDRLLAQKYPGLHVPFPSARSSSDSTGRPVCCNAGVCAACPIGSKFQVDLHMTDVYADPRVTLVSGANVTHVDLQAGRATGVSFRIGEREHQAQADLVAVGAHAIMTPFILLSSGLRDAALGRYLNEQISVDVHLDLDGVENFDGGQAASGLGLMFLDGAFRAERPGALVESWNVPLLRAERGRWRHRAKLTFVFEDIPAPENRVEIATEDPTRPAVSYARYSPYMQKGLDSVVRLTEELIAGLPVESYVLDPPEDLGGVWHIQGTTRMGTDPADSVVDPNLMHHSVRNLVVLGGGAFPTCPAANPTLTLSALSMRAAERLFS